MNIIILGIVIYIVSMLISLVCKAILEIPCSITYTVKDVFTANFPGSEGIVFLIWWPILNTAVAFIFMVFTFSDLFIYRLKNLSKTSLMYQILHVSLK